MMRVRVITLAFAISILIISSCTSSESAERMPVTTDSELALKLYETGLVAFDQLKWGLAVRSFDMAVKEDSDFFMAYFWLYFLKSKNSKGIAEKAYQSDVQLNSAEEQIKSALKYLQDGQNEKVVEHLEKVIEMYPSDPNVHKILYQLQFHFMKDYEGTIESLDRAINECPEFPAAYNLLGYSHIELEQFDDAEEALDTYVRLAPGLANPYDSKGDFFMKTKQFGKAYESYMKAYEVDDSFTVSMKKAQKAKKLQEKTDL
jgi:tetratricopeptide (TPR) repeat protein